MKGQCATLWAESLKVWRSKMFMMTLLGFAFIAVMMGFLMYIARHPEIADRSATMSAKASIIGNADWPSFFSLQIQGILALGAIGFGMVASWVFGREYADRTAKELLALPVSRFRIVTAKFIVILAWCAALALTMFAAGLLSGMMIRVPGWSTAGALHAFGVFSGSALLTLLLCTPVAFFACVSRGYLLPIAFAILTLIVTNFVAIGLPAIMPYFPWAIPALYSGIAGREPLPPATAVSYLIVAATSLAGFIGTVAWWRFADQT